MPVTLPAYVAPNELIQSAWGNSVVDAFDEANDLFMPKTGGAFSGAVSGLTPVSVNHLATKGYVDDETVLKVDLAGDEMTGQLIIDTGGAIIPLVVRNGSDAPAIAWRSQADFEYAAIIGEATGVSIRADVDIIFRPNDVDCGRFIDGVFLVGKTTSDVDNDGVEILATGAVLSTTAAAGTRNLLFQHQGTADADAELFTQFLRTTSGTEIGAVRQYSTTGIEVDVTRGFVSFTEISDPAAGAANTGRLYVKDNGSGKSQLVVRFNSGAVQVIATEP